jgi:hypothetical protein
MKDEIFQHDLDDSNQYSGMDWEKLMRLPILDIPANERLRPVYETRTSLRKRFFKKIQNKRNKFKEQYEQLRNEMNNDTIQQSDM